MNIIKRKSEIKQEYDIKIKKLEQELLDTKNDLQFLIAGVDNQNFQENNQKKASPCENSKKQYKTVSSKNE